MMIMTRTHAPSTLGSLAPLSSLLPIGQMCQLVVLRIWHNVVSAGSLRLPNLRGGNAFSAATNGTANAADTNRAARTFNAVFGVDVAAGTGSYVDGFSGLVGREGIPADGKEPRRCWSHKWRNRA
jgi:hypothetical protein